MELERLGFSAVKDACKTTLSSDINARVKPLFAVEILPPFLFADALSILSLSASLKDKGFTQVARPQGKMLNDWQAAIDTVLENHLPGSSSQPGKPAFLTEQQLERIYFDTVSFKGRLIGRLFPEAAAQIPAILAGLDEQGVLFRDFHDAATETERTGAPVWVAARAKFSTPQFIRDDWPVPVNESRSILFLSGPLLQGDYDYSDNYFRNAPVSSFPPMEMRASLFWIPEVWGYGALYADRPHGFKRGEPRELWVFGAISKHSDGFSVKPYAISRK